MVKYCYCFCYGYCSVAIRAKLSKVQYLDVFITGTCTRTFNYYSSYLLLMCLIIEDILIRPE